MSSSASFMKPEVTKAKELIKAGDREAGRSLLVEVLKTDKRDIAAWKLMYGLVEEPSRKRKILDTILGFDPMDEQAQKLSARLDALDGMSSGSEIDDIPPVIEPPKRKREVVDKSAEEVNRLMNRARSLVQEKKYSEALSTVNKVLVIDPQNETARRFADKIDDLILQPGTPTTVIQTKSGPGCLIRGIWFLFVGWWLGLLATELAFLSMLTIILLPVSFWLIARLPSIITLAPQENLLVVEAGSVTSVRKQVEQRPFIIRALWFLVVGWWLTFIWLHAAFVFTSIVITLPLGLWLYRRAAWVQTLRRS